MMNPARRLACRVIDALNHLRRTEGRLPRLAAIAEQAGLPLLLVQAELDRLEMRGRLRRGLFDPRSYRDIYYWGPRRNVLADERTAA